MTYTLDTLPAGINFLDHLDRQADIPTVTRCAAQGDLLIAATNAMTRKTVARPNARWVDVPVEGVAIIDGTNTGGHSHTLHGAARITFDVQHPSNLAICLIEVLGLATVQHPEHGALILDAGTGLFECRGQREQAEEIRRVQD